MSVSSSSSHFTSSSDFFTESSNVFDNESLNEPVGVEDIKEPEETSSRQIELHPSWYQVHQVKTVVAQIFYLLGVTSLIAATLSAAGFPYVIAAGIAYHAAITGAVSLILSYLIRQWPSWHDPKYREEVLNEIVSEVVSSRLPFQEVLEKFHIEKDVHGLFTEQSLAKRLNLAGYFDEELQRFQSSKFVNTHGEMAASLLTRPQKDRLAQQIRIEAVQKGDKSLLKKGEELDLIKPEETLAQSTQICKKHALILCYTDFIRTYGENGLFNLNGEEKARLKLSLLDELAREKKRFKELKESRREELEKWNVTDKELINALLSVDETVLDNINFFQRSFGLEMVMHLTEDQKQRLRTPFLRQKFCVLLETSLEVFKALGISWNEIERMLLDERLTSFSEFIDRFGEEILSPKCFELRRKLGGGYTEEKSSLPRDLVSRLKSSFMLEIKTLHASKVPYGYSLGFTKDEFKALIASRWGGMQMITAIGKGESDLFRVLLEELKIFTSLEMRTLLLRPFIHLPIRVAVEYYQELFESGILTLKDIWCEQNESKITESRTLREIVNSYSEKFLKIGLLTWNRDTNRAEPSAAVNELVVVSATVKRVVISSIQRNIPLVTYGNGGLLSSDRDEDKLILDFSLLSDDVKLLIDRYEKEVREVRVKFTSERENVVRNREQYIDSYRKTLKEETSKIKQDQLSKLDTKSHALQVRVDDCQAYHDSIEDKIENIHEEISCNNEAIEDLESKQKQKMSALANSSYSEKSISNSTLEDSHYQTESLRLLFRNMELENELRESERALEMAERELEGLSRELNVVKTERAILIKKLDDLAAQKEAMFNQSLIDSEREFKDSLAAMERTQGITIEQKGAALHQELSALVP